MQDGFGCGVHTAVPRSYRNRRFTESPIDALVHLVVWNGLCRHIPIWLSSHPVIHLRITTVLRQRRPACRGDVRWLGLHPDVIEYLPDVDTVRDERADAHLSTTDRAHQGKHLVRSSAARYSPGRSGLQPMLLSSSHPRTSTACRCGRRLCSVPTSTRRFSQACGPAGAVTKMCESA